MVPNKKVRKSSENFYCEKCHYSTSRKSQYDRHLTTDKHQILTNPNDLVPKKCVNYDCICGKSYKHSSSLCAHKKNCKNKNNNLIESSVSINNELVFDKEFVMLVLKQNSDLQTQMMEQQTKFIEQHNHMMEVIKNGTNNTLINNISNNKTFNLNVFLNEQCKDAMNIMEFVDSLKLQISDLETVGKLGFVEGISNIIVKNLKALDIHKRPVHCSDSKREVMYIKDEDRWEKENEERIKLRKAIKYIAHKNSKMLPEFKSKYPDCVHSNSKKSDQYNKLIIEAMGGSGDNDTEKEDKIIKKIAKEVIIDKNLE
jgi:hypothetical protein